MSHCLHVSCWWNTCGRCVLVDFFFPHLLGCKIRKVIKFVKKSLCRIMMSFSVNTEAGSDTLMLVLWWSEACLEITLTSYLPDLLTSDHLDLLPSWHLNLKPPWPLTFLTSYLKPPWLLTFLTSYLKPPWPLGVKQAWPETLSPHHQTQEHIEFCLQVPSLWCYNTLSHYI